MTVSYKASSFFAMVLVVAACAFGTVSFAFADGEFDTGWFDTYESYTPDTGWYDSYESYTPNTGWYDSYESYTPNTGWYDTYESYSPQTGWYDTYDSYSPGNYGSGCGYSCGSYGGGGYSSGCGYFCGGTSYTTPTCYNCGGSYSVKPTSGYPVTISQPGGSQQQQQQQTQTSNNTNTNTNVNVNNNTAIAVAQVQIGSQTATQPTYPTYPSYPTYPAPYCNIYQAQSYATGYGTVRPVYLSWNSSNAQSAYLSNYGSVSVNGSQTVYPSYTTTYTLTVYGYNGQQATCQTTVYGTTYVPPVQPTTPYVSLTQIPYTGFDFGPVGNAMYWAGLAIIALGGAYLAVYFIPQLAFARSSYKRTFAPVVAPKAPILLEREAAEAKVAPIVAALRKNGTSDSMAIVHVKGSMPRIVVDRS